jgi:hypothetical protein
MIQDANDEWEVCDFLMNRTDNNIVPDLVCVKPDDFEYDDVCRFCPTTESKS